MNVTAAMELVRDLKSRVAAAAGSAWWLTASEASMVQTFNNLADSWLALAREVESNPSAQYPDGKPKSAVLAELAPRLVMHAENNVAIFDDVGFTAAVRRFAVGFPAALRETVSSAVGGATEIVSDAALGLAVPVLAIGLGAVALIFLFTKSGGQLRTPFLKLGG